MKNKHHKITTCFPAGQKNLRMIKNISALFICLMAITATAQKKKDSINTEIINVVSSYKPTISDAFKSKNVPVIERNQTEKQQLQYEIVSKPIQSVFKPNPGGYKSAKSGKKSEHFSNYIKFGYGNYSTPLVDGFAYKQFKEHETQFFLYNKSSAGGIDGLQLDDTYLTTKLELDYKNTQRNYNWQAGMKYHRDIINWYGIPFEYNQDVIDGIEEKQTYNRFVLNGAIHFNEGHLKDIKASMSSFSDGFSSSEMELKFGSTLEFPLQTNKIVTSLNLDILNGNFKNDYANTEAINYGYFTLGAGAYYPIQKEDLYFSVGAKLAYNNDLENNNSNFHIYPDIKIDYAVVQEIFNIYGGITGGLHQNSFRSIAGINPYVSPTIDIRPTDKSFAGFIGLKGKLSSQINYTLKASYSQENDRLLFRSNQNLSDGAIPVTYGYQAGNSFYALYDNVGTFGLFGELNAELTDDFNVGASLQINSYTMETASEAWNLPPFNAVIHATYAFEKWTAKAELFSKGARKDIQIDNNGAETPIDLDAYVDLNLSTNYHINSKWTAFLDLSNMLNNNYEVYNHYQVQGFQIMLGASYYFDF